MFISESLDSQCKEAAASGGSIIKDYRFFHRREEKEKWYSLSLRAIYSEGKVEEFQGVASDLTEIKAAEMSLVEANKKMNLLASVSRQNVMNQLTVAQGFVSIALSEEKEPRTIEHLKKAEAAIRSINGHLEFTRDYQRTGMVIPVWINLSDSLEKAAVDFRSKGINIVIDVSNIDVLADPLAEKVFYNLIENSDKHGGGVKNIWITAQEKDNGLILAFEDDGKGIPLKDKERIFQVGSGMNASYGLFLAREILSSAGITIQENGLEGKGARFEVMFPSNRFRRAPQMVST
jgi:signal transduction histidine kinase